jgi:hypothetical protein
VNHQDRDSATGVAGAPHNPGRRRFASTGAKASGVILTLASAPGMATECRSPSGSVSGTLKSSPGTQTVVCAGLSPGYWKNWPQAWPPGCYPEASGTRAATTFASVFPNGSTSLYQTGTLMEVLKSNEKGEDPYNLGAHLVAAYLNVKSRKINYLTVEQLKTIWHNLYTYGYYQPKAGERWYAERVAQYLESTEN